MTDDDKVAPWPADSLQAAHAQWRWRGRERPPFARTPGPGQESVWDYPRPPVLATDAREVDRAGEALLPRPPSFYLPWDDVARHHLMLAAGVSLCEWKGSARYWSLVDGARSLPRVAWSYPQPLKGAEPLAECVAFYPGNLECSVGGAPVTPQPGRFYGGWVTPELVGPFKGEPGSESW